MIMFSTLKYLNLLNSKYAGPLHTCYNYESMMCWYVYMSLGQIPMELGQLSNLEILTANDNSLTGTRL